MPQPAIQLVTRPRCSAAREIQQDIHRLERSIDEALEGGGALLCSMMRVSLNNELPASLGQAALERTIASLDAGIIMRSNVLAAHDELREISGKIDLRALGFGDLVNSPKTARM